MGHPLFEDRSVKAGSVGMGIEMIPADISEVDNIGLCYCAFVRDHGFSDSKVLEMFSEHMDAWILVLTTHLVLPGYLSERRW